MKRPSLRKYLLGMAAGFGAIALGIAFFFLLYRFDGVRRAANTLTAILMPFLYGGAIAYLLKPFCNWAETGLRRLLPSRAGRAAGPLAVAASLLFGLLVVYALCLMIIPQLIGSILALSSSLPAQLDGLADWLGRLFEDDPALYRFLDPVKALWFVLFILILQQLDGNVIGPKILGNTTGLSSFWVLFSILLFGGLWGFAGMIVGVPLFAVLYDLVRKGTLWGLARKGQDARLAAYHDAFCPPPDPAELREKDP